MLTPYILVRMAAIMKTNIKLWKGVDKEDAHTRLGEMQTSPVTLKVSVEISQKLKLDLPSFNFKLKIN